MRATSHPKRKNRQVRARARREENLNNYAVGNFENARNKEHAIARAKEDVKNLEKKVPSYKAVSEW